MFEDKKVSMIPLQIMGRHEVGNVCTILKLASYKKTKFNWLIYTQYMPFSARIGLYYPGSTSTSQEASNRRFNHSQSWRYYIGDFEIMLNIEPQLSRWLLGENRRHLIFFLTPKLKREREKIYFVCLSLLFHFSF